MDMSGHDMSGHEWTGDIDLGHEWIVNLLWSSGAPHTVTKQECANRSLPRIPYIHSPAAHHHANRFPSNFTV